MWLSSWVYISELLDEWNLSSCRTVSTPFPSNYSDLPSAPPLSLPSISDADLVPQYQWLVGCLLYLAISTCPDISFYAMWLGQFNATPTRVHLLLAKHVLRYLAGTCTLALSLGAPSSRIPSTLSGYVQNVGCADADWASDTIDRKSIRATRTFFRDLSCLGQLLNRRQLHFLLLKRNIMLWRILSRKPFGSVLFFVCWNCLSLVPFLFLVIIRLLVPYRILPPSLLALNISTSITILSMIMFKRILFQLLGYLLQICQQIFLPKHYLLFLFLTIAMFLAFPFLLLPFNFNFLLLFLSWWGCVDIGHWFRTSTFMITWLHSYINLAQSICSSVVTSSFPTLRIMPCRV